MYSVTLFYILQRSPKTSEQRYDNNTNNIFFYSATLCILQAVREAATICPAPCKLTFDLLTLKVVSQSRVTWATSVPILVFPGLSVLDLDPMYATDRQTSYAHHRSMPPTLGAGA